MTDTDEFARAQAALAAPAAAPDTHLLGAVHHGLLSVPTDPPSRHTVGGHDDDRPQLAVRRRSVV